MLSQRKQRVAALELSAEQPLAKTQASIDIHSTGGPYSLSPTQGDESASSSSLSTNTDSDSLRSIATRNNNNHSPPVINSKINSNNNNNNNLNPSPKSPILIKYNYYDYNGARHEQTNHDMNYFSAANQHHNQSAAMTQYAQPQVSGKVQRQLSPTFKQNLDQIVRNSQMQWAQQQQQQQSAVAAQQVNSNGNSKSASPEHPAASFALRLQRRYKLSSYEQRCLRCNKTVYQMDKVGPLKDFTFYHQNCFKCRECGTKLTLKTYFNNQQSSGDQEVYCHRHCPKTGPGRLDNQSVGIRLALNAPKVFEANGQHPWASAEGHAPIEDRLGGAGIGPHSPTNRHFNYLAADGRGASHRTGSPNGGGASSPYVDSRALHIQHAVRQTQLQNIYRHPPPTGSQQAARQQVDGKQIAQFIEGRLEYLEPKQKMLEMRHREEEDALFRAFELKWRQEESHISEQIREEWQLELSKLLDKYKRQLSSISASTNQNQNPSQNQRTASTKLQPQASIQPQAKDMNPQATSEQQQPQEQQQQSSKMIEFERMNLEKTMTIKLDRKKETLKRKLKEFERQATAELVEKQSREMLALISIKLDEYKEEQKRKIGSDLEQFEAIDSLANQLAGASVQLDAGGQDKSKQATSAAHAAAQPNGKSQAANRKSPAAKATSSSPVTAAAGNIEIPAPRPPLVSKMELYNSEEPDEVFRDIDQLAINVAREDQRTFTDLVHHLTRNCLTDIEKVRAIFRWITVKNLNTMQFDSSVKPDTPLGLLRGIKNGSESYHVLFKRLCSYAGLHCVVIKGYSKSAGYQPGVRFEGNRFRNSWNAVFVAGSWRFVQCNWGARHLVSVAVMQDKNQPTAAASGKLQAAADQTPAAGLLVGQSLRLAHAAPSASQPATNHIRSQHQQQEIAATANHRSILSPNSSNSHNNNHGRRGLASSSNGNGNSSCSSHEVAQFGASSQPPAIQSNGHQSAAISNKLQSPTSGHKPRSSTAASGVATGAIRSTQAADSLRYEYDDHYFLTDPDEFIYEFLPLAPEWQLLKTRPISLAEFEQLPFVRSLFFKYGLYFPQHDIRSVLYADSSGATTIKIGMPTHMVPSLIFHYNLKYYDSDLEHYEGVSLKRFVMQSVESGAANDAQTLLSNIVSFRVHLPENGAYILDIFANSTTPTQYITGEPMKFKSVCKFKIIAKNLRTVMVPLPDCASGEYGPMKATRLFGIIPITHESGLISVQNEKRYLEIQFRMTRPLLDFMASLHKNGYDERQLSKSIKIFIEGDIVFVTIKFFEDGQYGLDIYTRDHQTNSKPIDQLAQEVAKKQNGSPENQIIKSPPEPKKHLLTHCCKYLINVRTSHNL